MITITPVPRALLPVDSDSATHLSAPNYDEFQGDEEVWEIIRTNPTSVLRITMAHCDVDTPELIGLADSEGSLIRAVSNMDELIESELTKEAHDVLWIYEIEDPRRPSVHQIGLGGMARTDEIRTEATPNGVIIRNEGIHVSKARGRADLIKATQTIIGTVNNMFEDVSGLIQQALEVYAKKNAPDFEVVIDSGSHHRVWLVSEKAAIRRFQILFAQEPYAYVADGNHRSAAANMLGYEHFLAVFFPARTMGIAPYNRLVRERTTDPDPANFSVQTSVLEEVPANQLTKVVRAKFQIKEAPGSGAYQPTETHRIGLYAAGLGWVRLRPLHGTFDPEDAAGAIDAQIVQKNLFEPFLGISDPGDGRLTYVGSNKDSSWLQKEVDEGRAAYAVTLPPVSMEEFIEVCRQNRHMPPKSTWFEPKIRSGLVMALLD
ncbi:uncharacterized protein METZ01_LOCUS174463 [marine metagenome]|uniref:DUF1015 domain-containing protein n=1 Tax=marine metagenome TaxID=408172 RepID=A0A382C6V5_9ZZZZ